MTRRLRSLLPLALSVCPSLALQLKMSTGAADIANFAVRQSPSSTRFVTNKMCPFAQKAWIALEVTKAPYEMTEISLYGAGGKPDWFMELNPDGTVPVLECYGGAMVLPDSDMILDHIANGAVEGGIALKAPDDKTSQLVKEWRKDIAKILPIGKEVVQGGSNKKKLFDMLRGMDNKVVGPFLCGEKVTIADCAAFPFLWRLDNEFGLEECPNIRVWLDTCREIDAFAKTVQRNWWWWW